MDDGLTWACGALVGQQWAVYEWELTRNSAEYGTKKSRQLHTTHYSTHTAKIKKSGKNKNKKPLNLARGQTHTQATAKKSRKWE